MEIIPAIMPKDFAELEEKARLAYKFVKTLHVDVMDGTLTHHQCWPFLDGQPAEFRELTTGAKTLPFWKEVDYEVDVMMNKPEDTFAEWVNAGFHRVIIHVESTQKFRKIISEWKGVVEIGAAIGTETPLQELDKLIYDGVDFVQFMGIAEIGFQGSPFEKTVLERIATLRKQNPGLTLSADGSVNLQTAPDLLKAGVNRLVIGSALYKQVIPESKPSEETETPGLVDLGYDDPSSGVKRMTNELGAAIQSFKKLEIKA